MNRRKLTKCGEDQILKLITAILITGFLASCATVPNVTLHYYPAKWESKATIIQTIGCSADNTIMVIRNTPSIETIYSSNFDAEPFSINIKYLDGPLSDSTFTMTFTKDGRLESINQSTAGQGEAVVKSAVALAATLAGAALMTEGPKPEKECEKIKKWGSGKPITLLYEATIKSKNLGIETPPKFKPKGESGPFVEILNNLGDQLPILEAKIGSMKDIKSGASYEGLNNAESDNMVLLKLQKSGYFKIDFFAIDKLKRDKSSIGTAEVIVPKSSNEQDTYFLPIPKAALFGEQTFKLTLYDGGGVKSVGYGKKTGAGSAIGAIGQMPGPFTAEAKAARTKAEADLIAQEQRLVLCQTKPDECK